MGIGRRQVPQIEVDYATLSAALLAGELEPLKDYVITDFRTRYTLDYVGTVLDGPVEPIVVKALSNNTISRTATSLIRPQDELIYDINNTEGGADMGRVLSRTDRDLNLTAPFDWRVVQFRRWYNHVSIPTKHKPVYIYDISTLPYPFTVTSIVENGSPVSLLSVNITDKESLVANINSQISGIASIPEDGSDYLIIEVNNYTDTYGNYIYNGVSVLSPTNDPYDVTPNISWSDYYTFHDGCRDIRINAVSTPSNSIYGNVVFIQNNILDIVSNVKIGDNSFWITFHGNNRDNSIGSGMQVGVFLNNSNRNDIGDACGNIYLDINVAGNNIGSGTLFTTLLASCENNVIGNDCTYLKLGSGSSRNILGSNLINVTTNSNFNNNKIGNSCANLTFNSGCTGNQIGDYCTFIVLALNCEDNIIGYRCDFVSLGNNARRNRIYANSNSNGLGDNCFNNTIHDNSNNNVLGDSCNDNIIHQSSNFNTIGNLSSNNNIGSGSTFNMIGTSSNNNYIYNGSSSNTIGNNSNSNSIYTSSSGNNIGNSSSNNIIYSNSDTNVINNSCNQNVIYSYSNSNQISQQCNNNSIGSNSINNVIGQTSSSNNIGNYCTGNTLSFSNNNNTIGDYCNNNTINSSLNNNRIYDISGTIITDSNHNFEHLTLHGVNGFSELTLHTPYTPSGSSDAAGVVGTVAWDNNHIYVKTTLHGWRRANISNF